MDFELLLQQLLLTLIFRNKEYLIQIETESPVSAGRLLHTDATSMQSTSRSLLSSAPHSATVPISAPAQAPKSAPSAAAAPSLSGRRSLLSYIPPTAAPEHHSAPAPSPGLATEAPRTAPTGSAAPALSGRRSLMSTAPHPAAAPVSLPASHNASPPATAAPHLAPAAAGAPSSTKLSG